MATTGLVAQLINAVPVFTNNIAKPMAVAGTPTQDRAVNQKHYAALALEIATQQRALLAFLRAYQAMKRQGMEYPIITLDLGKGHVARVNSQMLQAELLPLLKNKQVTKILQDFNLEQADAGIFLDYLADCAPLQRAYVASHVAIKQEGLATESIQSAVNKSAQFRDLVLGQTSISSRISNGVLNFFRAIPLVRVAVNTLAPLETRQEAMPTWERYVRNIPVLGGLIVGAIRLFAPAPTVFKSLLQQENIALEAANVDSIVATAPFDNDASQLARGRLLDTVLVEGQMPAAENLVKLMLSTSLVQQAKGNTRPVNHVVYQHFQACSADYKPTCAKQMLDVLINENELKPEYAVKLRQARFISARFSLINLLRKANDDAALAKIDFTGEELAKLLISNEPYMVPGLVTPMTVGQMAAKVLMAKVANAYPYRAKLQQFLASQHVDGYTDAAALQQVLAQVAKGEEHQLRQDINQVFNPIAQVDDGVVGELAEDEAAYEPAVATTQFIVIVHQQDNDGNTHALELAAVTPQHWAALLASEEEGIAKQMASELQKPSREAERNSLSVELVAKGNMLTQDMVLAYLEYVANGGVKAEYQYAAAIDAAITALMNITEKHEEEDIARASSLHAVSELAQRVASTEVWNGVLTAVDKGLTTGYDMDVSVNGSVAEVNSRQGVAYDMNASVNGGDAQITGYHEDTYDMDGSVNGLSTTATDDLATHSVLAVSPIAKVDTAAGAYNLDDLVEHEAHNHDGENLGDAWNVTHFAQAKRLADKQEEEEAKQVVDDPFAAFAPTQLNFGGTN